MTGRDGGKLADPASRAEAIKSSSMDKSFAWSGHYRFRSRKPIDLRLRIGAGPRALVGATISGSVGGRTRGWVGGMPQVAWHMEEASDDGDDATASVAPLPPCDALFSPATPRRLIRIHMTKVTQVQGSKAPACRALGRRRGVVGVVDNFPPRDRSIRAPPPPPQSNKAKSPAFPRGARHTSPRARHTAL